MNDKVATPGEVLSLVLSEAQNRGIDWFKEHHAAGMTGSFMQETGDFRADVINFEVRGDQGTAHGLMQWRGDRYNNLVSFARDNNLAATDIRTQVAFAFEEMDSSSAFADYGSVRALRQFRGAENAQQTATAFVHAERPAGYDGNPNNAHDVGNRINHAARALGQFTGDEDLVRLGAQGEYSSVQPFDQSTSNAGSFGSDQRGGQNALTPSAGQGQLMSEHMIAGLQNNGFGLPTGPTNNNRQRPAAVRSPEIPNGSGRPNFGIQSTQTGLPENPVTDQTDFSFGLPPVEQQMTGQQSLSFGNLGLTSDSTFDNVSTNFGATNF